MEGLPAKGGDGREKLALMKQPKVLHPEKLVVWAGKDQLIFKAPRAVLRDDHAQFQTPQQEKAVRLAAVKKTPLVVVLPTDGGKRLLCMVPAMLSKSGVTIVVAPYAELKRQLMIRCINAGLDCKHWPEARVVQVSVEAASSDDFLQCAADLRVRGELDRMFIDEWHLTFPDSEYLNKVRV